MKKKLLLGVLLLIVCLSVVGCGKTDNQTESKKDNKETVKKEKFESYKEFTADNYREVIKNVFGIDPIEDSNWVFENVTDFYFDGEEGTGYAYYSYRFDLNDDDNYGIEMKRRLFDAINAISTDGVYGYEDISDEGEFIKSEKLDFNSALNYKYGWLYYWDGSELEAEMEVFYDGATVRLSRYKIEK